MAAGYTQQDIKKLWGIAKSPGLKLTDEELHMVVETHTGKDSIRSLNKRELQTVIRVLCQLKDSAGTGKKNYQRGNTATENQRKKIYRLAQELGWDKPERINGLCRKMFSTDRVEWLDYKQCSKLIEALKSMLARQGDEQNAAGK